MNGATYILIYIRYFNGRKELYMSNNNLEITYKELMELDKSQYQLIDMRSESALSYGTIPQSIHIPEQEI